MSNEGSLTFEQLKSYKIDFEKVNTLEDVISILQAMNITIYGKGKEYEALKHYLKDE